MRKRALLLNVNAPPNPMSHLLLFGALAFLAVFNLKAMWGSLDQMLDGSTDCSTFYLGAVSIRQGQGHKLYDYPTQHALQMSLFPTVIGRPEPFLDLHPAYELLIWLPLSYTRYVVALAIWTLGNLLIVIALSLYLPKYFTNLRAYFPFPWILPLMAFYPIIVTLIRGQDSILLLLLYSLAYVSLKDHRPYRAGFFLAMGLFKFHLVLPFVAIYMLLRQWKVVAGFLAGSVLPISVSLYIAGRQGAYDYFATLVRINQLLENTIRQKIPVTPGDMPNLRGLLYSIADNSVSRQTFIALAVLCYALLIAITAILLSKERDQENHDLRFSLAMLNTVLVSHYFLSHDAVLLLIPMIVIWDHLVPRSTSLAGTSILLAAPLILLMISPLYPILNSRQELFLLSIPILTLLAYGWHLQFSRIRTSEVR